MVLLLLAMAALAQSPQGPGIGLVLSSGGAHALAEAGVLDALEQLHVPVDLVVGSEAGALIGGLYAAGLGAREVHEFLENPVVLDALNGRIPRTYLSWRQRSVDRDFLIALPVSFGPGHFGLARGLARTRWISWLLSSATLRSAGAVRFDDLPIPFRALSTDLLSGESRVLDSGSLPTAILASMATPGQYAPVEIDGREFGSGALLDPIPMDAALAADCKLLIVVDCALEVAQGERLDSFVSAAAHVRVLAGEAARRAALARLRPGDLLLSPEAADADEVDFRGAQALIERGRAAVLSRAGEFAPLALEPAAWAEHIARRQARRPKLPVLGELCFEDESGLDASVVRARVTSEPGQPLVEGNLSKDLLALYGLDYHERIDVSLEQPRAGVADLHLRMHEAEDEQWNPRAGIALEGAFGKDATYAIGGAFTCRPMDGLGAEWRNRIEVGSRVLLYSEFWQPIDSSARWFVAPAIAYQQQRENFASDGDVLATLDVWSLGGRVDLGCVLGNWGEARVGLLKQTGNIDLAVGQPGSVPSDSFDQGFFEGSVTIDTVDSLALPHEGSIGRVVITSPVSWLGGEEQSYLSAQLDHAITWNRTTLVLGAEFDTALDDQQVLQNTFPLGGFLRLSGLGRDVINGAHVGLARAVSWVELGSRGLDRKLMGWNLGVSLEAGQAWSQRSDIALDDLRLGGSVFVAAETMFGPIFLGVGATEPGQTALFLLFGNLFGNWDPF